MERNSLKRSSTPSNNCEKANLNFSVGRPKHEKVMITTDSQDTYVGENIVILITLMLNPVGKIQGRTEAELPC